jgi:hypothetical protein
MGECVHMAGECMLLSGHKGQKEISLDAVVRGMACGHMHVHKLRLPESINTSSALCL